MQIILARRHHRAGCPGVQDEALCARPTRRRSSSRRADDREAKRSARTARFALSASNTHSPTTNASIGVGPNGNAAG